MTRINERAAAEAFINRLRKGEFPIDRSKNEEVNYCMEKEARDTEAVKKFLDSELFVQFLEIE